MDQTNGSCGHLVISIGSPNSIMRAWAESTPCYTCSRQVRNGLVDPREVYLVRDTLSFQVMPEGFLLKEQADNAARIMNEKVGIPHNYSVTTISIR